MVTSSLSRSKFTYSSPKNPCPVCGRTKDSDCRVDAKGFCHCRTYAKENLRVGQVVRGHDGQQWAYLGDSDGGRWAMFKPHEERYDRKPNLTSFNKSSPTKPASKPVSAPSTAKKAPRPKGEQNYIYHDENGYPLIKVVRKDDGQGRKEIRQFRYENGKWIPGLNDQVTKRVRLYRIAEARALSEKTGHPIFLVEGESCVERLLELGIPATTSIGGAKKWTGYGGHNYLHDLQGCRIILSPDADRPGLAHMKEIELSLRQHGIEIAGWLLAPPEAPWENLPESGGLDVVDWLENGATAEEILGSVQVTLPAHLAVDEEVEDLATEVGELTRLDQKSGITLLPKDLDTPLRRIAEGLGIPVEAYYLVLLCVVAGLIPSQTRLEVDPRFQFSVPPILWGGLVGETGSGKSHIINTLTRPLQDLQAEYYTQYQHRLEGYKTALREWERKRKGEDVEDPPERPKPVSLYASDYTMEAIGQVLSNQPDRGLLVSPDELTTFLRSMDAYRRGKGADRAHWLSLYNGDALKVDRKNSDQIFVRFTSVSVVGGIQPSLLQKAWQEDKDSGDGLWSRFAWVRVPLVPEPDTQEGPVHNPRRLLEAVYRRLQALPPQQHELDGEGRRLWNEWKREINELILTEPNEQIRACLPKVKERAARIALILHCLDAACAGVTPSKVVPASTLARAIEFTRWLQNQARLIYGELGESSSPEASLVIRFVKRFQGCGSIDLKRCRAWWPTRRKPPMSEIRKFVEGVVQMGHARWLDHKTIEVIQPYSNRPCSHVVTQKPESLAQTGSEQVTPAASPSSHKTSSAVTPADGDKPAQPEPRPSLQRKEEPKQASLPPDSPDHPRGFKPTEPNRSTTRPSVEGIPPWRWEV